MSNVLVSIRIPKSLVEEFREVSKKDHFLDLSEGIRSVVRDKWIESIDPSSYQLKIIRKEISDLISKQNNERIVAELDKIKNMLKNGK